MKLRPLTPVLIAITIISTQAREVASLFAPEETVPVGRIIANRGGEVQNTPQGLLIKGPGGDTPSGFIIHPPGESWDLNTWNHLHIDFKNEGENLARIAARIDNPGAADYIDSMPGTAIVPVGHDGTLGFSFNRARKLYDGPPIFNSQTAMPNGHRFNWRRFDPTEIIAIRFTVHSDGPFSLRVAPPSVSWSYGSEANSDLEELPYLDRFGQTRVLEWPAKLKSIEELTTALTTEAEAAKNSTIPARNRFGGWKDGPKQTTTGFFHTQKIDGRWWLIDPEGALFWSHGANSVRLQANTPAHPPRLPLFEWLPEPGDPLHEIILQPQRGNRPVVANFLEGNVARALGDDYAAKARDLNHNRLRTWGINTLGAWSEPDMFPEERTPYTHIVAAWSPNLVPGARHLMPDPFDPAHEANVRQRLENIATTSRDDPWCLGVFIDNEIDWTNNLAPYLFAAAPDRAAKSAFKDQLKEQYTDIQALNEAWGTSLDSWDALIALRKPPEVPDDKSNIFTRDMNRFYAVLADRYYETCARLMREIMPNHLYLGSRIHRAPQFVMEAAARHVDVFSANEYSLTGASSKLPAEFDIPFITGEFHFAAPDRGVPGTGLFGVNDQKQRGLAYMAYLSATLLDPRVVGAHWFAFPDQSAAGRPGENNQIGMIDITGRTYPEFAAAVRRVSRHLYPIRKNPPHSIEASLEIMLSD